MASKTIWKFPIQILDDVTVCMPAEAELLSFQAQDDRLCLWALVNPDRAKVYRRFYVVGTGNPVPWDGEGLNYIGTTQLGGYVWHLFEDVTKPPSPWPHEHSRK